MDRFRGHRDPSIAHRRLRKKVVRRLYRNRWVRLPVDRSQSRAARKARPGGQMRSEVEAMMMMRRKLARSCSVRWKTVLGMSLQLGNSQATSRRQVQRIQRIWSTNPQHAEPCWNSGCESSCSELSLSPPTPEQPLFCGCSGVSDLPSLLSLRLSYPPLSPPSPLPSAEP